MRNLTLKSNFPAPAPGDQDFVTGTITSAFPMTMREEIWFIAATVQLDKPVNGIETVGAILMYDDGRCTGNRLRGKLQFDAKQQQENLRRHGMTGYNRAANFMLYNPGIYFDLKTLHLAADDPAVVQSKHPVEANASVLGQMRHDYDQYYIDHGYEIKEINRISAIPKSLHFSHILNLLPWRKSAKTDQPTLPSP